MKYTLLFLLMFLTATMIPYLLSSYNPLSDGYKYTYFNESTNETVTTYKDVYCGDEYFELCMIQGFGLLSIIFSFCVFIIIIKSSTRDHIVTFFKIVLVMVTIVFLFCFILYIQYYFIGSRARFMYSTHGDEINDTIVSIMFIDSMIAVCTLMVHLCTMTIKDEVYKYKDKIDSLV